MKVLLVEDDELLGAMVELNLGAMGAEVTWLKEGRGAVDQARATAFDLIVLDITLPGKDGIRVLQELRRHEEGAPVLMLTARTDVPTKVRTLDAGADDYLTKPFDIEELLARAKALVRRSHSQRQIPSDQLVKIGDSTVNLETREAKTEQGEVLLSEREVALVKLLATSGGQPLSRNDILDEVWGMDATPTERTVDNFFLRLRKLFEKDPKNPQHILTVRGVGYRLR